MIHHRFMNTNPWHDHTKFEIDNRAFQCAQSDIFQQDVIISIFKF